MKHHQSNRAGSQSHRHSDWEKSSVVHAIVKPSQRLVGGVVAIISEGFHAGRVVSFPDEGVHLPNVQLEEVVFFSKDKVNRAAAETRSNSSPLRFEAPLEGASFSRDSAEEARIRMDLEASKELQKLVSIRAEVVSRFAQHKEAAKGRPPQIRFNRDEEVSQQVGHEVQPETAEFVPAGREEPVEDNRPHVALPFAFLHPVGSHQSWNLATASRMMVASTEASVSGIMEAMDKFHDADKEFGLAQPLGVTLGAWIKYGEWDNRLFQVGGPIRSVCQAAAWAMQQIEDDGGFSLAAAFISPDKQSAGILMTSLSEGEFDLDPVAYLENRKPQQKQKKNRGQKVSIDSLIAPAAITIDAEESETSVSPAPEAPVAPAPEAPAPASEVTTQVVEASASAPEVQAIEVQSESPAQENPTSDSPAVDSAAQSATAASQVVVADGIGETPGDSMGVDTTPAAVEELSDDAKAIAEMMAGLDPAQRALLAKLATAGK